MTLSIQMYLTKRVMRTN